MDRTEATPDGWTPIGEELDKADSAFLEEQLEIMGIETHTKVLTTGHGNKQYRLMLLVPTQAKEQAQEVLDRIFHNNEKESNSHEQHSIPGKRIALTVLGFMTGMRLGGSFFRGSIVPLLSGVLLAFTAYLVMTGSIMNSTRESAPVAGDCEVPDDNLDSKGNIS